MAMTEAEVFDMVWMEESFGLLVARAGLNTPGTIMWRYQ
jgi:hypothetical protein